MEQPKTNCCVGCGRDTAGELCPVCDRQGKTQINDKLDRAIVPIFSRDSHIPLEDDYSETSGGDKVLD